MKLETKLVHEGEPRIQGAVAMPVFQSSTYEFSGEELRYLRLNNTPNHDALHRKLAAIDSAEAGLVTSSGMAAIAMTLLAVTSPGDHMLVQSGLYGGTFTFIRDHLRRIGVDYTVVDATKPATWADAFQERTVGFYLETITNPTMEVADLVGAAAFCAERNVTSVVDNTFASPINFRPIEIGIDVVVQSATKYLNGHSDLVAGAVTGSASWVGKIRGELNQWGGTLDPHTCVLLQRGMKTLALRVRQQNANANALAVALQGHARVASVNYPTLPSHPQHAYVREHFQGGGGVLSFELTTGVDPQAFVRNLRLVIPAPSLGGPESLVVLPAVTSHVGLSAEEREKHGISDALVRISVGIEAAEDIVEDVLAALDRLD